MIRTGEALAPLWVLASLGHGIACVLMVAQLDTPEGERVHTLAVAAAPGRSLVRPAVAYGLVVGCIP